MRGAKESRKVIRLCLVNADHTIVDVCQTVLEELCAGQYNIQERSVSDTPDGADIYIWEAGSDLPAPMASAGPATKLVIVSKPLFASVRSALPHDNFVFLQSPVTKLAIRVFLESTIARLELCRDDKGPLLDRDRILQRLLETNLKLQEYDQDRTNFLSRVVHDIRVPLMAVQGYCGLLLAGQLGKVNSEQTRILERMQRSLTRLGDLASAMTEFGSGSNPSARLDVRSSSLDACVNQAVHEIAPLAAQKQISVNLELEEPSGSLMFDAGQLEQVLVNLLDNGCKFTPRRGTIEVRGYSVSSDELRAPVSLDFLSGYRIDVSDTGPGIPPAHIEDIFNEYTSYSGPSDRSGAGLGLAICRMIINAHNGRIWANPEGQGAKFSLVLPYVRMHIETEAVEPMRAAV